MGNEIFIIAIIGVVAAVILLMMSFRAGRSEPNFYIPWVIAMVLLGISVAFRFIIVMGGLLNEQGIEVLPVLVGNLAVIIVFVAAFWQPRLAGWTLIGSAIAMPLMTLIAEAIFNERFPEETVALVMTGTYSVPAIVTGTLLVLSIKQLNANSRHTNNKVLISQ